MNADKIFQAAVTAMIADGLLELDYCCSWSVQAIFKKGKFTGYADELLPILMTRLRENLPAQVQWGEGGIFFGGPIDRHYQEVRKLMIVKKIFTTRFFLNILTHDSLIILTVYKNL